MNGIDHHESQPSISQFVSSSQGAATSATVGMATATTAPMFVEGPMNGGEHYPHVLHDVGIEVLY